MSPQGITEYWEPEYLQPVRDWLARGAYGIPVSISDALAGRVAPSQRMGGAGSTSAWGAQAGNVNLAPHGQATPGASGNLAGTLGVDPGGPVDGAGRQGAGGGGRTKKPGGGGAPPPPVAPKAGKKKRQRANKSAKAKAALQQVARFQKPKPTRAPTLGGAPGKGKGKGKVGNEQTCYSFEWRTEGPCKDMPLWTPTSQCKNPSPDGKPRKHCCQYCGSADHFSKDCPQAPAA